MVEEPWDEVSRVRWKEDLLSDEEVFQNSIENNFRRGEDKPRVIEHRLKRHRRQTYGKLRNEEIIQKRMKTKQMKSDLDENGESSLSKFTTWCKRQKENKKYLKKLEYLYNYYDIKDIIHDHVIVSSEEVKNKISLENLRHGIYSSNRINSISKDVFKEVPR